MRSSIRAMGPAAFLAFLVLWPAAGALAEDADFDGGITDGSQIEPAGADPYVPRAGNLNSVPVAGGFLQDRPQSDSPLVKQILTSRPNEDLVICIAGCYSGFNRVVFAQPSAKAMKGSLSSTMVPADPQKLGLADKPRRAAAIDPQTPAIINRTN
jgi:hypothetical protein